jgi:hypothetical protein
VRDVRSTFLLKLILIDRAGLDPEPLLEAQRAAVVPAVEALEARLAASGRTERILVHFRLESTRAVVHFIDSLLEERRSSDATAAAPRAGG